MSKILKKFEGFTLWSEDYKKLAQWYEEKFGLKRMFELDMPDDQAIAFEIEEGSEMYLWIGYHSEVQGESKDPYRSMISYIVDDVQAAFDTLKSRGVEFIAEPHASPDGSLNVATAVDPERNLIQLFSTGGK